MKKTFSAVLALILLFSIVQFAAAVEMPEDPGLPEGEQFIEPQDGQPMPPEGWDPELDGPFPPEGWDPHAGNPEVPELYEGDDAMPPGPHPEEGPEHFAPVPPGEPHELPGITPDHKFLWNLDLALEKLDLAMTFSPSEKATKKLVHASERIAEAKAMVEQKMFEDAMHAQNEHDQIIKDLEEILKKLKGENGPEELDELQEIEDSVEEHEEMVGDFKDNMKGLKKGLSPEQMAMIEQMAAQFGASVEDIDIQVNAKKDRVIIKMKLAKQEDAFGEPHPEPGSPEEPGWEGMPEDQLPPGPDMEEPDFLEESEWID